MVVIHHEEEIVIRRLLIALCTLALVVTLAPLNASAQGEVPTKLTIGMVPSRETGAIVDTLEPFARMLSQRLLIPVDTFVSTSYTGLVEAMGTGRIDVGFFGPAAMVQAMDRYGAQPIVAHVRRGYSYYKAQFNVRCDSGIESFEQLRGRSIAFVDPASASGYQFPYVFLKNEFGIDANTDMDAIFAGSHDGAMLAVYNGDVDVAVTFGGTPGSDGRTTIQNDFPDVMDEVCILGYTSEIPNDGAVVRAGLDPEFVEQLVEALFDIAQTEEGVAFMDLLNANGYERVTSEAYDIVRAVAAEFQRD
jgi:phosphonate transport system substrate-binding protein